MTALMEVQDLTKRYGGFTALDKVTLTLSDDAPSMTAVAGESGSGKTTLARMMLGFIEPTEGAVLYAGKDVAKMSASEKRQFRREVQPVFQDPFEVFNPFYRIDHVLTTPVKRYHLADTEAKAQALIEDALKRVGLRPQDTLGRFPHELSGGQRQRVMVARAVLLRPRMIVADEPVSMVDASLRATILDELRTLNRDLGISIVYITHDLTTAFQICDNIVVLYRGTVAEAGAVERVIGDPKHPYSQLLVSSIPLPDLDKVWGTDEIPVTEANAARANSGCPFAPRCPSVMEQCWRRPPPKFVPDTQRLATCYLYENSPEAPDDDVASVFRPPQPVNSDVGNPI
ncbi:ABC transporter ATP-binding protein [Devosia algicola]|uniref:ABC transporter ATP-binding protein n=1 Tax=Devosia algicola TaxID=3026418 RepID=A0ABY7YQ61_9HYPH|nr:ABC transporter ATP-binding protein [Devosia algicola]WDR03453.1 ABC transporter ATP-binding protein [Devosia algicola]